MELALRGIGVSPGIAIGPALLFDVDRYDVPHFAISDTALELARFNVAVEKTRIYLNNIYRSVTAQLGKKHADIFEAHLMLLDDVMIRQEVSERIEAEKINVEYILNSLTQRYVKVLQAVDEPLIQERTADLLDVLDRIMRNLLDAEKKNLQALEKPQIILAHEIAPSDTASIDLKHTLGLVLDTGSATSHAAILARALGIPAVMGIKHASSCVEPDSTVVLDGVSGVVIFNPTPETVARFREEQERYRLRHESLRRTAEHGPAHTQDGKTVPCYANIELPLGIQSAINAQAQGIGLYRTEFLFLNRDTLPDEEEQYDAYRRAAESFSPAPVTLRTIDIGGDKLVSHLNISREDNPQLGWRAVRFCLERPDIFKVQLRAMLRASAHGNVQIMFPMISSVEELRRVKVLVDAVRKELIEEEKPFDEALKCGIMIEVPSAVALARALARECDFFSIGTNDLIQYSLAVDRVNEKIAHLYDPAHPAVVRMLDWTCRAAHLEKIPCSICGEMAGDPMYTELLIGLGFTSLSMTPIALQAVRAAMSRVDSAEARKLAQITREMSTSQEIRALLVDRMNAALQKDSQSAGTGQAHLPGVHT
ncbi:MAG: phosphoenolpyruvate--protein phosphotransferase [Candidatus Hydrogenedentes bacterium]|nr:phosphoenolpyruvate--protein phosphotransferase [Candidatus Hydrogenedentota bacterium]